MSAGVRGRGQACGKTILLGEHFVVHGVPALALPLTGATTSVRVSRVDAGDPWVEAAPVPLDEAAHAQSLQLVRAAHRALGLDGAPSWRVEVTTRVPVGHGLGSSAAFGVALLRALAAAGGRELELAELGRLGHQLERLVHGNPSGIDDTVVTRERPLWFERGAAPRLVQPSAELDAGLVLASSGRPGSTREAVAAVQALRERDPRGFDSLCRQASAVTAAGLRAYQAGDSWTLGAQMDRNHELLVRIGVSLPVLDHLVRVAREAGAVGAKLTGGGRGGFVITLCERDALPRVEQALRQAGAAAILRVARDTAGAER